MKNPTDVNNHIPHVYTYSSFYGPMFQCFFVFIFISYIIKHLSTFQMDLH